MSDDPPTPSPPEGQVPPEGDHGHHGKKHKNKVRSAWISFVGRIIAQVAGAAATIVIGLAVVNEYSNKRAAQQSAGEGLAATQQAPRRAEVAADEIDLAVLPLENLSADPGQEYFADGVTEALIANLARIEGLHVISRTSSMHFKGLRKSIPEIAAELSVDFVVEGTVAANGGRVRVMVQLVDAVADHELWVRSYDRPRGDVLALQAEISSTIAREVNALVSPAVEQRLSRQPQVMPAVYEQYIRGRQTAASRSVAGLQSSLRHFEEAIRMDPGFALAHAGLATTYVLLGMTLEPAWPPERALALARTSGARALDLDPALAEAQAALAVVSQRLDWDWSASEERYRLAKGLRPGDALVREWYAVFLAEQGRHREALAEAEFALELDPLLSDAHTTLGLVHYYARRFDRAALAARRAIDLDPAAVRARLILAWSLIEQGDSAAAIAVCETRPWRTGLDLMLATLADAHRRRGRVARADEIRGELLALRAASPYALVRLHLSRADLNAAFAVLDQAVTDRSDFVRAIRVDPLFARMKRDRRFAGVLERLTLE